MSRIYEQDVGVLSMNHWARITNAYLFAYAAHTAIDQRRKYTNEPYLHHLANVVELLEDYADTILLNEEEDEESLERATNIICAAYLHDVVEDTKITLDDIQRHFNEEITMMVDFLTDHAKPEDGNRKKRKQMYRDRLITAPNDVKTIKIADIIDNLSTIVAHDPGFAVVYVKEKRDDLPALIGGDQKLYDQLVGVIHRAEKDLGIV